MPPVACRTYKDLNLQNREQFAYACFDSKFRRDQRRPRLGPGLSDLPQNKAVTSLWMADKLSKQGDSQNAHRLFEMATEWILGASSQEHLCLLHLVTARIALTEGNDSEARSALDEGLYIAERARFRIYEIDLLLEKARMGWDNGDKNRARQAAQRAMDLASDSDCLYREAMRNAQRYLSKR